MTNPTEKDEIGETDINKATLIAAMRSSFEDMVATFLQGVSDARTYAQLLAQEFNRYLWRSVHEGDKRAEENLRDLKVQVLLLATKCRLAVAHDLIDRLKAAVEIAAQFAVKTLLAAVVAL